MLCIGLILQLLNRYLKASTYTCVIRKGDRCFYKYVKASVLKPFPSISQPNEEIMILDLGSQL